MIGKCKVLVVDPESIFRHTLCETLAAQSDLAVVGQTGSGRHAVALAAERRPDVLLLDAVLPRLSAADTIRQVLAEAARCRPLALSRHTGSSVVLQAMEAGAYGYVVKSAAFEELLDAIKAVRAAKTYLSPAIAEIVVEGCFHHGGRSRRGRLNGRENNGHGEDRRGVPVRVLTPREREVLQLLAEGLSSKQIALLLTVSVKTIDTHRMAVMRKLALPSLAHLTKYAIREGLTTAEA